MLALSVSISTSSSPRWTSSPSDFSHFRIVPSSIESDRRGIATSAMPGGYRADALGGVRPPRSMRGQLGESEAPLGREPAGAAGEHRLQRGFVRAALVGVQQLLERAPREL